MPFRPSLTITTLLLLLHNTLSATTAQAILPLQDRQDNNSSSKKPPAWFLAGDSTTALQNEDGGGWGAGFLSFVRAPAWGTDYAVDGSTTVSFVDNGYWAAVLAAVGNSTGVYNPLVTIQFGHNDQKAAANISLEEYQTNLETLATEVKSAGGTPILVTPLTRRDFTSEYNLTYNLVDQRLYTIYAAGNTSTWYIDLNQASSDYVATIGETAAQRYNLNVTDETHLNAWGSVVFGRMVADLLLGHAPVVPSPAAEANWVPSKRDWLTQWFLPNQTLSDELWSGIPA